MRAFGRQGRYPFGILGLLNDLKGKSDVSILGIPSGGFVTFAHFTCQPRFALKDCAKENQSFGALEVGARSTENGLFLGSVTMPTQRIFSKAEDIVGMAATVRPCQSFVSQALHRPVEMRGGRQGRQHGPSLHDVHREVTSASPPLCHPRVGDLVDTAFCPRRRHRLVRAITRAIVDRRGLIVPEIAAVFFIVTEEAHHRCAQALPFR